MNTILIDHSRQCRMSFLVDIMPKTRKMGHLENRRLPLASFYSRPKRGTLKKHEPPKTSNPPSAPTASPPEGPAEHRVQRQQLLAALLFHEVVEESGEALRFWESTQQLKPPAKK